MNRFLNAGGTQYSRLVIGAVLLAAGSGSRMGHRPKSLLQLDGVPLVRRQLIALSEAGMDEVVLVLGHHAGLIKPIVRDFPVKVVHNPDPNSDQIASLRLGLQSLSKNLDTVLVALVDQPLINTQDIRDAIVAYRNRPEGTQVVVPTIDSLPGNPVIFSADVKEQILAGDTRLGCKQWQASHPDAVHRWETSNRHYRIDVDTPDDIESLLQQSGLRLKWPEDNISRT